MRRPRGLIPLLAAIGAFSSIAIHMLVPALPTLADEFGVRAEISQRTVSFYLLGLAAGQLVAGLLADRIGRRPVMIGGLCLFALGAIGATMAPSLPWLLAARVVQAAGGAAGMVVSRVIVGDVFDPAEGGEKQANLMAAVLLSPAVAPAIGGFLVGHGGWRWIMGVQAVVAIGVLALAFRILTESMSPASRASGRITENYRRVLANGEFGRTVTCVACSTGSLYMFLSTAPFLLIKQWGLTESEAGLCFLLTAVTAIIGTRMVKLLEGRTDPLPVGVACGCAGALLTLALSLVAGGHWWALVGPVLLITLGAGIAAPAGTARVLQLEKGLAATASSLAGAIQIAFSGLVTVVLAAASEPSFVALGIAMSVLTCFSFAVVPRKHRA